jgi:hypothetical protein
LFIGAIVVPLEEEMRAEIAQTYREGSALRALSISSNTPFTIDDSAQPGFSRDDSTSNVYFPYEASSGM